MKLREIWTLGVLRGMSQDDLAALRAEIIGDGRNPTPAQLRRFERAVRDRRREAA